MIEPTRITDNFLIDHMYVSEKCNVTTDVGISDHGLTYAVRKLKGAKRKTHVTVSFRSYKNFVPSEYLKDLNHVVGD